VLKQAIQDLLAAEQSYRAIRSRVRCSFSAISSAKRGDPFIPKKMGRPKKITEEISNYIEILSSIDASLTNGVIAAKIYDRLGKTLSEQSVSAERIRLGFHWRPPLVKQELTAAQEHQRVQFAMDIAEMRIDPAAIIFSDEPRFVLGDDNSWGHLRKGEWNETAFVTKTKFPISVMIWGAIGVGYKSGCIFCSNGVDSGEYQAIVLKESDLVTEMDGRVGKYRWYFMQDGASAHTSRSTAEAFREACLILPGWPPNSPDLNPIEMVWAIMKRRVRKEKPQTKEELQKVITDVWNELDQDLLDHMVASFNKRVDLVIGGRGRSISQYLSSHRKEATAEDAAANQDFRAYGPDEDAAILDLVDRIGNRWKRIAEILLERGFGHRERTSIKNPVKMLHDLRHNQILHDANQRAEQLPEEEKEEEFSPETFFDPKVPGLGFA
jgi:hypothetical protein